MPIWCGVHEVERVLRDRVIPHQWWGIAHAAAVYIVDLKNLCFRCRPWDSGSTFSKPHMCVRE